MCAAADNSYALFVLLLQQERPLDTVKQSIFFAATAADCGAFSTSESSVALPQAVLGLLLVVRFSLLSISFSALKYGGLVLHLPLCGFHPLRTICD